MADHALPQHPLWQRWTEATKPNQQREQGDEPHTKPTTLQNSTSALSSFDRNLIRISFSPIKWASSEPNHPAAQPSFDSDTCTWLVALAARAEILTKKTVVYTVGREICH